MLGYVIPLFGYKNVWHILGLMYLVPLGYGLFLRYFSSYKSILFAKTVSSKKEKKKSLSACSHPSKLYTSAPNYLHCFQQSLTSAIEQITILGGCMVFFNCLLIFPQMLGKLLSNNLLHFDTLLFTSILSSFIEIGGGLQQLSTFHYELNSPVSSFLLPLSLLTFGGLSCIAQTYFIIKNTGLKISTYIKHKIIQSCIFILLLHFL